MSAPEKQPSPSRKPAADAPPKSVPAPSAPPRPGIGLGQLGAPPPLRAGGRPVMISEPDAERGSDPPISQPPPRSQPPRGSLSPRDAESSLEIPPPAEIEEDRPPGGAKDPYIGTTFDHRYKIDRLIGEGGMGFVYLARHKVIDKKVAVKVLRAELARDREIFDRFVQEARAASSIGNPHIVDVSDFGELPDGSMYFVMEHLDGVSLAEVIDNATGDIPIERICHIGMQLSAGLAAAHDAGIIHRDLKPDNVFLVQHGADSDFVKILDFGIAKVSTSAESQITRAGAVFGTPHYMSPEQAAGAPIDYRADIYSLGVMLYELISRQLPFNADNFMGILTQHMYKAPVPIRALVGAPDCPPGLEAVVLKCLSKKPEARYQTMYELHDDLEIVRKGGVPKAVPEMMARSGGFNVPVDYFKPKPAIVPATPPAPPRSPWPRYVWIAGAAAAVGLVTAIFVISGSTTGQEPAPPAPQAGAEAPPAAAALPPQPAAMKKTTVTVAASPDTAVAYRDGAALPLPTSVDVEEGKTVTLEIRADGYLPQTVELDGKEERKIVKLAKEDAKPASTKPAATRGSGQKTSSEIRDPWAPKRRKH